MSARAQSNWLKSCACAVSHVTADQTNKLPTITLLRLKRSARNPADGLRSAYTHRNTEVSRPNCASVIVISALIESRIVVSINRSR